ncbi:Putative Multiple RNA-binding domain-containing protein [Penicillium brasilianum]|uniref:Multiple RNA-binding domain-containing protein 1 n=1 Tax=Penicillium brasilianum TaxID=104259 RepID=A0A0F7TCH7_PENBI|nr:Putative Multiple RNA-binding domain-containing protein [Penicillium brasilianum]
MENTRVFVSGLPPTCSNDQLRNHFASRFTVTDAHVLPKRRMGFVGFKSNEAAQEAVNYFNRTYMKMSRISVDLARPIDSKPTEGAHPTRKRDAMEAASDHALKRKRDADSKPQDPKLQEYLALAQTSSKTRTWANDDSTAMAMAAEQAVAPINTPAQDTSPSEELPSHPKKVRREPAFDADAEKPQTMEVDRPDEDVEEVTPVQEETEAAQDETGPVSDSDWLRSKTSRLLGLLDEDEQAEFDQHKVAQPAESSRDVEESRTAAFEDVHPQPVTDDATVEDGDAVETTPERPDPNVDLIRDSARLFVRNLAYDTTDADLQPLFAPFGKLDEIHVAFDTRTETSKGFAYIQYTNADAALDAYRALDGKHFQGRLLHILPAAAKKTYKIDDVELSKLPLKKQKQIKRKMGATSTAFSWNSLYMNADAVMSSVADRLGVSKAELLDPTSSDAAVKQAHAETHVIQETKAYFASNGVNIEAFKGRERGNTAILVKNFSFGVKSAELRSLFEPFGQILRLLMPPSGTIAIVEFSRPDQAQAAFKSLAYRKIGDSILFLEKAPKNLFDGTVTPTALPETQAKSQGFSTSDTFAADEPETGITSTLFVKNLNFSTTNDGFLEVFRPLDGFVTGRIKTKPDPKRPGQTLSMGFGFAEFRTKAQAQAALAAMDGYKLDQHELVIRASHKGMDAAEERRREDTAKKIAARRTKIIIKNLPFQVTKKDIRSLFGAYGQLRSVRVPQKFDRSARGFGFADFISAREAENAMDALKNTHLLGRRLVLEFANEEAVDPEDEIAKIEKKVGEQVDRVKLQQLTSGGRKKFTVGAEEDES